MHHLVNWTKTNSVKLRPTRPGPYRSCQPRLRLVKLRAMHIAHPGQAQNNFTGQSQYKTCNSSKLKTTTYCWEFTWIVNALDIRLGKMGSLEPWSRVTLENHFGKSIACYNKPWLCSKAPRLQRFRFANTRYQNVWPGWPVYEVICLCSRGRKGGHSH